jgi:L-lactate dehydrogenase complex protein LldG
MNSRERILNKLRAAQQPFTDVPPRTEYRHYVPDVSLENLTGRFIEEARKLGCKVSLHDDAESAIDQLMTILNGDKSLIGWDFSQIPLTGLSAALGSAQVTVIPQSAGKEAAATARVGVSGVTAALASTGSLILTSGEGRPRGASLLPPLHVAVVAQGQIVPDFETWATTHPDFRAASNHVVITGASRTADIAMEVVMGVHGPGQVHILVV